MGSWGGPFHPPTFSPPPFSPEPTIPTKKFHQNPFIRFYRYKNNSKQNRTYYQDGLTLSLLYFACSLTKSEMYSDFCLAKPSCNSLHLKLTHKRTMITIELSRLLNRAVTYLENNLTQPASVSEAAWHAGYSRHHFTRTFLATTGITPADYLRKRRLSEAARTLTQSSKPIIEIALDYQFQSQEAFTRSFRQEFGISPGFFRRRGRLKRLLQPIRIGCTNLLHPGRGIHRQSPILLPERKVVTAMYATQVQPGVYLFQMVTPTAKPTITSASCPSTGYSRIVCALL